MTRAPKFFRNTCEANARVLQSIERAPDQRARRRLPSMVHSGAQNASKPVSLKILSRLRSEVLSAALELGPARGCRSLFDVAQEPPGQLKPIVLSLARVDAKDSFLLRRRVKFWCEGGRRVQQGILSDAIHPGSATSKNAVFLDGESEHPRVDEL